MNISYKSNIGSVELNNDRNEYRFQFPNAMFFIAYLVKPETHVVVPVTWVYNYEEIIQKFIRKSINSNQKCLIFYSKKNIDGIPDGSIDGNFTAPISLVFPIADEEACFIAKITHYYSKLNLFFLYFFI